MSQTVSQALMGLPQITQPPIPLLIRGDLMPSEEKTEMETDELESAIDEPECEPPAPGTEEPSIQDHIPSPSKFLFCFLK